jgi:hypothetical protein
MKKLFLICTMIFCFGYASAQETPMKSKTKTDSVYNKKGKQNAEKGKHKNDTVNTNHTQKKAKTKSSGTPTTKQRRDTINGPTTP